MKNSQRGSTKVWIIIGLVVVVAVVAGYYIFSSGKGMCRVTRGTVTTYEPCPTTAPDQVVAQSEYDKVGQTMKDVAAKYRTTSPSGYLVPASIPVGYTLSKAGPSFTVDHASYTYHDNTGNDLTYTEYAGSYAENMAGMNDRTGYTVLKTFTYNGSEGKIIKVNTTIGGSAVSTQFLAYNHNGNYVTIQSNDPQISSADTLISMLKSMTIAQ